MILIGLRQLLLIVKFPLRLGNSAGIIMVWLPDNSGVPRNTETGNKGKYLIAAESLAPGNLCRISSICASPSTAF